jgi:preprotein translocase subunit SecG
MEILILVIHVFVAFGIIGLVMLQHGKGADMGAAFGSGTSGSLFGASGSANFLSRTTAILALVFFLTSLGLTYLSSRKGDYQGVMSTPPAPVQTLPDQIPSTGAAVKDAAPAAPAKGGSKVEDVPK